MTGLTARNVAILIPLLVWQCYQGGAKGAAIAVLATAAIMLPLNYIYVARAVGVRLADLWSAIGRSIIASALMALVVLDALALLIRYFGGLPHAVVLAMLAALGALIYCTMIPYLWVQAGRPDGGEAYVIGRINEKIRKIRQ